jgi:heme exporter protein A
MFSKSEQESFPAQIDVRGLVKRYHHQPVLDHLDLTINDGDFCLLVGANGSGKTTLMRTLANLVRPDAGTIQMGPFELPRDAVRIRGKMGLIGHQPMVYGDLTAEENLVHYAHLYALTSGAASVQTALKEVGLLPYRHQPVRTFSRGMQQRLSIARALLPDPAFLLFDEPYTGLDREAIRFLDARLAALRQKGRVILLAAHRPRRILDLVTHVAWLEAGRIRSFLPAARLDEDPALLQYLQDVQ